MSLRRAASLRVSLIRSLLDNEFAIRSAATALPAGMQQCIIPSLRTFSGQQPLARAPFSASALIPTSAAAAEDAPVPSSDPEFPDVYVRGDRIAKKYTIQPQKVFAVVEVGGTQYKVTPDDIIVTERLEGVDINDTLRLQRVLLLGSAVETVIGRPYVPGAAVLAAVEEQFLDGKVIVFKKRRRKNSRRTNGHRQPLTSLRILAVEGIQAAAEAPEAAAETEAAAATAH